MQNSINVGPDMSKSNQATSSKEGMNNWTKTRMNEILLFCDFKLRVYVNLYNIENLPHFILKSSLDVAEFSFGNIKC